MTVRRACARAAAVLVVAVLAAPMTHGGASPTSDATATTRLVSSSTSVGAQEATFSRRVLDLVNRRRAAHGLRPVRLNRCVDGFAHDWARHLVRRDLYRHSDLSALLARCDSPYVSENIAQVGQGVTPRRMVRLWMRSPGHRANILSKLVTHSGVSVRWDADRRAWIAVQNFARRPGSYPG